MDEYVKLEDVIDAIQGCDWFHVNKNGQLVQGSNSDLESYYKAEDIYKAINRLPTVFVDH